MDCPMLSQCQIGFWWRGRGGDGEEGVWWRGRGDGGEKGGLKVKLSDPHCRSPSLHPSSLHQVARSPPSLLYLHSHLYHYTSHSLRHH